MSYITLSQIILAIWLVLKTGSVNQINHYPVDSIVFIVEPKTDLLACVPIIPAKRAFPHSDHV